MLFSSRKKIESKNLIFQMEALNKRLSREESGKIKMTRNASTIVSEILNNVSALSKQRGHLSAHASEGQCVEYANREIFSRTQN